MISAKRKARQILFEQVDLYPVTSKTFSRGRSNKEVLKACLACGVKIIQLRDKEASPRALLKEAKAFREMTLAAGTLLMINDHLEIALTVEADGVHLGQSDLPIEAARKIAPDLLLGQSCHTWDDMERAVYEDADYVNFGPIYATKTKKHSKKPLGLEFVREAAKKCPLPFTVMGGIKEEQVAQLKEAGARKIALITAITQADDMAEAAARLRKKILG